MAKKKNSPKDAETVSDQTAVDEKADETSDATEAKASEPATKSARKSAKKPARKPATGAKTAAGATGDDAPAEADKETPAPDAATDDTTGAEDGSAGAKGDAAAPGDDQTPPAAEDGDKADARAGDAPAEAKDDADAESAADAETGPETTDPETVEVVIETPPAPRPEPVVVEKGGFVPTALGGLAAGAIGFGIAMLVQPDAGPSAGDFSELQRKLDGQTGAVAKLTERVETVELAGTADLGTALSDNQAAISGLADRVAALETQLDNLAELPAGAGASDAALAAHARELEELRSAIDAMNENAAQIEKNAQAAARATLQRAALTRIMTALDAGSEFLSPLTDLQGLGIDAPAPLQESAASGVPSLADLQESFPDAARAALRATRGSGGGDGGFSSFLQSQLGARSLEPREGDDPDAILSRAEAAARDGRLGDALAEIETLPEDGRAELSDWVAQAMRRLDAVAAAQTLGEKLN